MAARIVVDGHVYKLYVDPGKLTIHDIYDEYVGHIVIDENCESASVNTENTSNSLNYFEALEMNLHQSVQLVINADL